MTDLFDGVAPVFARRLKPPKAPKLPDKPSDTAIRLAQRSYDGETIDGTKVHIMRHRFASAEMAESAADELKRASSYTDPPSSMRVVTDPDGTGDLLTLAWVAGARRGRGKAKSNGATPSSADGDSTEDVVSS